MHILDQQIKYNYNKLFFDIIHIKRRDDLLRGLSDSTQEFIPSKWDEIKRNVIKRIEIHIKQTVDHNFLRQSEYERLARIIIKYRLADVAKINNYLRGRGAFDTFV